MQLLGSIDYIQKYASLVRVFQIELFNAWCLNRIIFVGCYDENKTDLTELFTSHPMIIGSHTLGFGVNEEIPNTF